MLGGKLLQMIPFSSNGLKGLAYLCALPEGHADHKTGITFPSAQTAVKEVKSKAWFT